MGPLPEHQLLPREIQSVVNVVSVYSRVSLERVEGMLLSEACFVGRSGAHQMSGAPEFFYCDYPCPPRLNGHAPYPGNE